MAAWRQQIVRPDSGGCLKEVTVTWFQAAPSIANQRKERAMLHRRAVLSLIAAAGTLSASRIVLAKEKHHHNGNALLGAKIKQNGKHKIHAAGKVDVFAEVNNGKVVGVSATGMQVKKVKTRQKLAEPQTVPR